MGGRGGGLQCIPRLLQGDLKRKRDVHSPVLKLARGGVWQAGGGLLVLGQTAERENTSFKLEPVAHEQKLGLPFTRTEEGWISTIGCQISTEDCGKSS